MKKCKWPYKEHDFVKCAVREVGPDGVERVIYYEYICSRCGINIDGEKGIGR